MFRRSFLSLSSVLFGVPVAKAVEPTPQSDQFVTRAELAAILKECGYVVSAVDVTKKGYAMKDQFSSAFEASPAFQKLLARVDAIERPTGLALR